MLTGDDSVGQIEIGKEQIIAIEDLNDLGIAGVNKTRVYLKGGGFVDVRETATRIRELIQ